MVTFFVQKQLPMKANLNPKSNTNFLFETNQWKLNKPNVEYDGLGPSIYSL